MPEIGQTVLHYKIVEKPTSLGSEIPLVIDPGLWAIAEDWRHSVSQAEPSLGAETRS